MADIVSAVITEWTPYTPTSSWVANVTITGLWRRIGDTIECRVLISLSGAPTAATLTIAVPTGLSIDANKIPTATNAAIGFNYTLDATGPTVRGLGFCRRSTDNAESTNITTAPITITPVNATSPVTFATGDKFYLYFTAPITGW